MERLNIEKENIVKDIRNLSRQEKWTKVIKDRILWDIKNFFEYEKEKENYYKPIRVIVEVMVIKIKHYQLKNILIKLVHI